MILVGHERIINHADMIIKELLAVGIYPRQIQIKTPRDNENTVVEVDGIIVGKPKEGI